VTLPRRAGERLNGAVSRQLFDDFGVKERVESAPTHPEMMLL